MRPACQRPLERVGTPSAGLLDFVCRAFKAHHRQAAGEYIRDENLFRENSAGRLGL